MDRRSRMDIKRERSGDRSRSRSRGRDRSRDRPAGARLADKRVYISNIPYDSRWQDIKDLFRKEVGEVAFVELFNDEQDKPRGCGIIEFESPVSATKAIEKMHRFELGGRKIVVKEDYDVERDKYGRIVTGSTRKDEGRGGRDRSRERDMDMGGDWDRNNGSGVGQVAGGAGWKFGNTYGLSPQFLESLGIEGSLVPRVFVSNLDFRADEKKLKEVFRLAGRVLDVELNRDKDGKSRGHGVIEYEHPVEAVQAISMLNNQQLYERRMHVKMDRLADPLADLHKNKLPDGLKGIGMGLGMNGQPLVDVAISVAKSSINSSASGAGNAGQNPGSNSNTVANATPIVAAMNMNPTMGNLAIMANTPSVDMNNMSTAAALSNAFGMATGIGPMGLNPNQFAGGSTSAGNIAATLQNQVAMAQGVGNANPLSLMGTGGTQIGNPGGMGGGAGNPQPFQANPGSGPNANTGFRDMDYGYSTSVYSTPGTNYNSAYEREKQQYSNGTTGNSGGNGSGKSNTVIISNLPLTCSWQMLKTKFRECGEVVFAEMRDKGTGIVRFAQQRDAERAVKVFDQSRVDGRIVEVRFL